MTLQETEQIAAIINDNRKDVIDKDTNNLILDFVSEDLADCFEGTSEFMRNVFLSRCGFTSF